MEFRPIQNVGDFIQDLEAQGDTHLTSLDESHTCERRSLLTDCRLEKYDAIEDRGRSRVRHLVKLRPTRYENVTAQWSPSRSWRFRNR